MKFSALILAFILGGCGVPATVAIPLFTSAAIAGAGAAVGAGAVDIGWSHLPTVPTAGPTPVAEKP